MIATKIKLDEYCHDHFPLALQWNVHHETFPMHQHDFTEMVIVLRGNAIHKVNRLKYPIEAGSIFIIKQGECHGYQVPQNAFEMVNILFDINQIPLFDLKQVPDFFRLTTIEPQMRSSFPQQPLRLDPSKIGMMRTLLERFDQELKNKAPGYQAAAISLLIEIFILVLRHKANTTITGKEKLIDGLSQLLSWLEKNYTQQLNLEEMSQRATMSKRNFQRLFKQAIGLTPIEYLLQLRLNKAAQMLRQTHKNIQTVAAECGFVDSNYFSRRFRMAKGCSPREYRDR